MLRGLDSSTAKRVRYQRELANGKVIRNALQTNGVLLDEEWCAFLREAGFMVGSALTARKKSMMPHAWTSKDGQPSIAVMHGIGATEEVQH